MRTIILQDAAALLKLPDYKDNPVLKHPVFDTENFKKFQDELLIHMDTDDPFSAQIASIAPAIASNLDGLTNIVTRTSSSIGTLNEKIGQLDSKINEFQNRNETIMKHQGNILLEQGNILRRWGQSLIQGSSSNSLVAPLVAPIEPPNELNELPAQDISNETSLPDLPPQLTAQEEMEIFSQNQEIRKIVKFQSRALTTVCQVMQEYNQGDIRNGRPSIQQMNSRYGSDWRVENSDSKFYGRRRQIYKAVDLLTKSPSTCDGSRNMSESEAIQFLDRMLARCKNSSLAKLQDKLKVLNSTAPDDIPYWRYLEDEIN
jgi:hypothetical protein